MTETELQPLPPSRRELNKAATRDAIAASALELLRAKGMGEFTVDDVADAAGVSRRTFFNYFSSAEAAIASYTQSYLDNVLAELLARPAEEPLLESAQQALIAVADPRHLASIAETFTLTHDHPQLSLASSLRRGTTAALRSSRPPPTGWAAALTNCTCTPWWDLSCLAGRPRWKFGSAGTAAI